MKKKIREAPSAIEKEKIRVDFKTYVYSLSDKDYQVYRKNALAKMNSEAEVIEKLFETYELMKKNMLQHS